MNKLHVKTGDTVVILSGKDKGKQGKVLEVSPKEQKVIVEGLNIVTKHVKPRQMGQQGGIVKCEAPFMPARLWLFALTAASLPDLVTRSKLTAASPEFARMQTAANLIDERSYLPWQQILRNYMSAQ